MAVQVCGEEAIQEVGGQIYIFRTSWVYSNIGHNFFLTMKKIKSERDEIKVVAINWGAHLELNLLRSKFNRSSLSLMKIIADLSPGAGWIMLLV